MEIKQQRSNESSRTRLKTSDVTERTPDGGQRKENVGENMAKNVASQSQYVQHTVEIRAVQSKDWLDVQMKDALNLPSLPRPILRPPLILSTTNYLQREIGGVLAPCLAHICEVRPHDPIDFIAHYLYKLADAEFYYYEKAIFNQQCLLLVLDFKRRQENKQRLLKQINNKMQVLAGTIMINHHHQTRSLARRLASSRVRSLDINLINMRAKRILEKMRDTYGITKARIFQHYDELVLPTVTREQNDELYKFLSEKSTKSSATEEDYNEEEISKLFSEATTHKSSKRSRRQSIKKGEKSRKKKDYRLTPRGVSFDFVPVKSSETDDFLSTDLSRWTDTADDGTSRWSDDDGMSKHSRRMACDIGFTDASNTVENLTKDFMEQYTESEKAQANSFKATRESILQVYDSLKTLENSKAFNKGIIDDSQFDLNSEHMKPTAKAGLITNVILSRMNQEDTEITKLNKKLQQARRKQWNISQILEEIEERKFHKQHLEQELKRTKCKNKIALKLIFNNKLDDYMVQWLDSLNDEELEKLCAESSAASKSSDKSEPKSETKSKRKSKGPPSKRSSVVSDGLLELMITTLEKDVKQTTECLEDEIPEKDHENPLKEGTEEKLMSMKNEYITELHQLEESKKLYDLDKQLLELILTSSSLNNFIEEKKIETQRRMDSLLTAIQNTRSSLTDAEKVMNDWNETRSIGKAKEYVIHNIEKQIKDIETGGNAYIEEFLNVKRSVDVNSTIDEYCESRKTIQSDQNDAISVSSKISEKQKLETQSQSAYSDYKSSSEVSKKLLKEKEEITSQSLQDDYKSNSEKKEPSIKRKKDVLSAIKSGNLQTYELSKVVISELKSNISNSKAAINDLEDQLRKVQTLRRLQSRSSLSDLMQNKNRQGKFGSSSEAKARLDSIFHHLEDAVPGRTEHLLDILGSDDEEDYLESEEDQMDSLPKKLEEKKRRYSKIKDDINNLKHMITENNDLLYEVIHNDEDESRIKVIESKTRNGAEIKQRIESTQIDFKKVEESIQDDKIILDQFLKFGELSVDDDLKISELKRKIMSAKPKLQKLMADLESQNEQLQIIDNDIKELANMDRHQMAKKLRLEIIDNKKEFINLEIKLYAILEEIEAGDDEKVVGEWLKKGMLKKNQKILNCVASMKKQIEEKRKLKEIIQENMRQTKEKINNLEPSLWACSHVDILREKDFDSFSISEYVKDSFKTSEESKSTHREQADDEYSEKLESIKSKIILSSELKLEKEISSLRSRSSGTPSAVSSIKKSKRERDSKSVKYVDSKQSNSEFSVTYMPSSTDSNKKRMSSIFDRRKSVCHSFSEDEMARKFSKVSKASKNEEVESSSDETLPKTRKDKKKVGKGMKSTLMGKKFDGKLFDRRKSSNYEPGHIYPFEPEEKSKRKSSVKKGRSRSVDLRVVQNEDVELSSDGEMTHKKRKEKTKSNKVMKSTPKGKTLERRKSLSDSQLYSDNIDQEEGSDGIYTKTSQGQDTRSSKNQKDESSSDGEMTPKKRREKTKSNKVMKSTPKGKTLERRKSLSDSQLYSDNIDQKEGSDGIYTKSSQDQDTRSSKNQKDESSSDEEMTPKKRKGKKKSSQVMKSSTVLPKGKYSDIGRRMSLSDSHLPSGYIDAEEVRNQTSKKQSRKRDKDYDSSGTSRPLTSASDSGVNPEERRHGTSKKKQEKRSAKRDKDVDTPEPVPLEYHPQVSVSDTDFLSKKRKVRKRGKSLEIRRSLSDSQIHSAHSDVEESKARRRDSGRRSRTTRPRESHSNNEASRVDLDTMAAKRRRDFGKGYKTQEPRSRSDPSRRGPDQEHKSSSGPAHTDQQKSTKNKPKQKAKGERSGPMSSAGIHLTDRDREDGEEYRDESEDEIYEEDNFGKDNLDDESAENTDEDYKYDDKSDVSETPPYGATSSRRTSKSRPRDRSRDTSRDRSRKASRENIYRKRSRSRSLQLSLRNVDSYEPNAVEWRLTRNLQLVCKHPLLGVLKTSKSRHRHLSSETATFWEENEFHCNSFYHGELYSVCNISSEEELDDIPNISPVSPKAKRSRTLSTKPPSKHYQTKQRNSQWK